MSVGVMFFLALLVSMVILAVAVLVFRHQRRLQETKASYMKCRKERGFHYRRYTNYQAELDRLRVSYNSRLRDLMVIDGEIDRIKDQIKEILEILREESKALDPEMEQDLSRIVTRRKTMIQTLWTELNGKKALWMEKIKKAKEDRRAQGALISKKDKEFQLLTDLNNQLNKLKRDYDQISRSSVISFGKDK